MIMTIGFFLLVYYLIFLKQKIPVEASKDFHFFDENLDEYLSRSEESIPNLKADLKANHLGAWTHSGSFRY